VPPSGTRPQPPVHACRFAIDGQYVGTPWTNVFYLNLLDDGTQTSADLKSVSDATVAAFFARFKPQVPTNWTLTDCKATWITGTGTALEYQGSYADAGTGTGTAEPANCCYVINWSINQYYRGGHPRTYLTGVLNSNFTNPNQITTAGQAALATAAVNFMNDVNALTATHITSVALGTVSFARGNAWRVPPVFYAYKGASCRQFLGTQRRRIGGR